MKIAIKQLRQIIREEADRLHEERPFTSHTAPRGNRGNPANIRGRKMDAFMDWGYLSGAIDQAVMKARQDMMAGIKKRDRNSVADAMRSLAKASEEGLRVLKTGDGKQDDIDLPTLDIDTNGF